MESGPMTLIQNLQYGMSKLARFVLTVLTLATYAAVSPVWAQSYPAKPIRLVIPSRPVRPRIWSGA
jgi:hypothetical protein